MAAEAKSYQTVIGLEVHLQIETQSKAFCGCSTTFGAPPNTQVCPVCLGFPGVLPVLNHRYLQLAMKVALGLKCRIRPDFVFHRKNYFYPDLPKGYQISQYDLPLGIGGVVELPDKSIRVHRVHMEEDTGKLIHKPEEDTSLVDFNRGGVPLLEIVSEPDITSPEEAQAYLKTLKGILQYLEVSDCDMEKGSLRCDANISLRKSVPGTKDKNRYQVPEGKLGTKVEIKNMNSFKAVARALAYEVQRQTQVLSEGGQIAQETRLWDDVQGVTMGMRSKEYAHDYRYFPEPDLVPFAVSEQEVAAVQQSLPELPRQRAQRLTETHRLPAVDATTLTASKGTADYFERCVELNAKMDPKLASNWILGDLAREMNDRNLDDVGQLKFTPEHLVELIQLIASGKISGKMAKEVFVEGLESGKAPRAVVEAKGLSQVTDRSALLAQAEEVIKEQPQAAEDFKNGKEQVLMFLVGQLMRKTRGAASPAVAQQVLRELLTKGK